MTTEIQEQLVVVLFLICGMMFTPLLFIALDFWAGIRKARTRKERIRSDKMQRTVAKMSRYYNAILAMLVLDAVQMAGFLFLHIYNDWTLYTFPVFTLISVAFVAAIEIKSILEPADAKEIKEFEKVGQLAQSILEHRQDPKEMAAAIAEYLRMENNNK